MFKTNIALAIAAAGALSTGAAMIAQAGPMEAPKYKFEKCYGVAKAGHNDCASAGNNSCAGTSKADNERAAWIFVPAGTCGKIKGGSTSAS